MKRRTRLVLYYLLLLSLSNVLVIAGTSTERSNSKKEAEIKAAKDKITTLEKDIKELQKKIDGNCESLKETIITANALTEIPSYHENKLLDSFVDDCKDNGYLSWTSKSFIDPKDPDRTTDQVNVKVWPTKLQASRTVENGVVELITEPASIELDDDVAKVKRLKWDLDLRERKNAQSFLSVLKDLGTNLKNRAQLKKKLTDAQAALAELEKPKEQKPKPKPKSRR